MQGQVLTVRVRVTLEAARGFQNDDACHFAVCQIPGKPHSQVQSSSQCVNDTEETSDLVWNETFELFDYQRGDSIEFAVYAQEKGEKAASVTGEDTSLGRAWLSWEAVSTSGPGGFEGELDLVDIWKHPTKTKMK